MIKRILPIACLGLLVIGNSACTSNNSGFKNVNGVEYKIISHNGGAKVNSGDLLKMNVVMRVGPGKATDSVIADSRKLNNNQPIPMQLGPANFRGDWLAALAMLSSGDSAVFRISVDTLQKGISQKAGSNQPLPPFMKPGQFLTYEIKVASVESAADYKKEMMAKQQNAMAQSQQQQQADDKTLQDYFAKNNIKPLKTQGGVYYTIQTEGTGAQVHNGQSVTLTYTGKTLDGKVFDSNTPGSKHTNPLTFTVGSHQVIPGMDEGMTMLKNGSKATLYIPSPLAYGPASPSPELPANSILVFDIVVNDVK